jgi:hypothetical protein
VLADRVDERAVQDDRRMVEGDQDGSRRPPVAQHAGQPFQRLVAQVAVVAARDARVAHHDAYARKVVHRVDRFRARRLAEQDLAVRPARVVVPGQISTGWRSPSSALTSSYSASVP